MWFKVILFFILLVTFAIGLIVCIGPTKWESQTNELLAQLEQSQVPLEVKVYDPAEIADLPAPIRRYFETVLQPGQPIIKSVRVKHSGTFNMSETSEQWKPFTSTQRVITRRPGFIWDARILMAPKMAVHVHDAYIAGDGILQGKLLGLITVVDMPRTPEMAQGELMRFFAEAAWYPTALLPSQGIQWETVNDSAAMATLQDGDLALTMRFTFSEDNLLKSVRAENRGRAIGEISTPTPWEGRFWNYQRRDGMLVPLDGDVAWLLPEGHQTYWRGHIETVEYEFAQ